MKSERPKRWMFVAAGAVLLCGLAVALSDAGLPFPAAVVTAAFAVCIAAVLGTGVVGYRKGRGEGRGVWGSMGAGIRTSFRTVFDLF